MKKKGFTLIELLAVIVILAIITVIAVPKILDVIEKSRRSAAEQSVKLYVDAFRLYQASAELNNKNNIPEGTYEVAKQTTINGETYKINDILTMKGSKPSSGTINVTNTGKIGTAKLCVNNYLITYQVGNTKILSDDCGDMELIVNFIISSDDWEKEKTLTISYPKKEGYKKYYKVESGKVLVNQEDVTINEINEVTIDEVVLTLKENSKIVAWLEKNGKKEGTVTYEEKKIDSTTLILPEILSEGIYPTLYKDGVKYGATITINKKNGSNTSLFYSLDKGVTYHEYTKPIFTKETHIQAKIVNNRTNEYKTSEIDVEPASDILGTNAYDGDDSTKERGAKTAYLKISDEMKGKKVRIIWEDSSSYTSMYHYFATTMKEEISSTRVEADNVKTTTIVSQIPENAEYLVFVMGQYCNVYEVEADDSPDIVRMSYPILKKSGVEYKKSIKINYDKKSIKKLYKIDYDEEWSEYDDSIELEASRVIYAKSIFGSDNESFTTTFRSDFLSPEAYDGDDSTRDHGVEGVGAKTGYLQISDEMKGKKVRIKWADKNSYDIVYHYFATASKEEISSTRVQLDNLESVDKTYDIPENAEYLVFYIGYSCHVYEVIPVYE